MVCRTTAEVARVETEEEMHRNAEMKKAHVINNVGLNSGGTDGTRTRDPLRDRQIF